MEKNMNFLCEIGTEEVPAGYIPPAIETIRSEFGKRLMEYRIGFDSVTVYATPRRFVILAGGMAASQSEEDSEIKGPSLKAAYDGSGKPTKALDGFLKGNQVEMGDIFNKMTEKGEYVFARKKLSARGTEEILPELLDFIVKSIPFPKKMKWSDKKLAFPRPINYFLVLFNDRVVNFEMSGIASSGRTRGHYIRYNRMIEIGRIDEYEKALKENGVIVNQNERREIIRKALALTAESLGGVLVADEELLETVTFLAESPFVVSCEFDRKFLEIPDIVLITEMKEHQKYFAVRDRKGALMAHFLVVSNNPPSPYIKAGNERVIRARFEDARFFFNEDRKTPLSAKVDSLKSVLFHKELGSIYDKVERVRFIAGYITAETGCDAETGRKIDRAVTLCKADLNTAMVYEFTSLQGKIGRIYALLDGEDSEVADAIDDHYKPRSQEDTLPSGTIGMVLSLAEKVDNLFGSYSVGNIPKGSADPYALRRQANAVVEMLLNAEVSLDMRKLLEACAPKYKNGKELIDKILAFISARANTIFAGRGFRYDEIDACLSVNYFDYLDIFRRAKSLHEFRENAGFSEMLLSFKRMNNIVSAFRQKNPDYRLEFTSTALKEDAEKNLFGFFDSRREQIGRYIKSNEYIALFGMLIEGKVIIDAFFDAVMVMVEDTALRDSRLAMLESILDLFKSMIDFSKISE